MKIFLDKQYRNMLMCKHDVFPYFYEETKGKGFQIRTAGKVYPYGEDYPDEGHSTSGALRRIHRERGPFSFAEAFPDDRPVDRENGL